jgi:hypothetical protein
MPVAGAVRIVGKVAIAAFAVSAEKVTVRMAVSRMVKAKTLSEIEPFLPVRSVVLFGAIARTASTDLRR